MKNKSFFILSLVLISILQINSANAMQVNENSEFEESVRIIADKNEVHTSAVGFVGEKTAVYKAYEYLLEIGTLSDLVKLTKHSSPAVRVYAYKGLVKKHYKKLDEIKNMLLKDQTEVRYFSGCLLMKCTVEELIKDSFLS